MTWVRSNWVYVCAHKGCTTPAIWADADQLFWCDAHRHSMVSKFTLADAAKEAGWKVLKDAVLQVWMEIAYDITPDNPDDPEELVQCCLDYGQLPADANAVYECLVAQFGDVAVLALLSDQLKLGY